MHPTPTPSFSQAAAAETKALVEVEEGLASKKAIETKAIADDAQRYVRTFVIISTLV